jgi:hypothetical protein
VLTNVPAAQFCQLVQDAAFALVEKLPLAHAEHTRSVVVLPFDTTYSPGWQVVRDVHAVAEFPSWSHVVVEHAAFGVVPPGQYVPAGHARQAGGLVEVAGEVCSVPAAHAVAGRHWLWFDVLEYMPLGQGVHT